MTPPDLPSLNTEPDAEPDADEPLDDALQRIVLRPDGYHWLAADGHQEFGPFETIEEALADMGSAQEGAIEPGESLAEAEQELGISGWLDPDTGAPAEATKTRIEEDH